VHPILSEIEVVLLTVRGAKTGREHVIPLTCFGLEEDFFVVASAGGSPRTPAWYYNLRKNPELWVERGTEKYQAVATLVEDPQERARLHAKAVEVRSEYGDFEEGAGRVIPVFVVRRKHKNPAA
jgi:deazaflavin-dependent oxidoreductase (nitroreductase family)